VGAPVTTIAERRPHRHAAVSAGGDQDQATVTGGRVRLLRDGLGLGNPRTYLRGCVFGDRHLPDRADWCSAADTGAELLWRVKSDLRLPLLELLPDGSYLSVLVSPKITGKARDRLIQAAHADRIWTRAVPGGCGWSSTRCRTGRATGRAS
jgi:hypothetical protein